MWRGHLTYQNVQEIVPCSEVSFIQRFSLLGIPLTLKGPFDLNSTDNNEITCKHIHVVLLHAHVHVVWC